MPASSKESSRNGLSGSASARPEPASCSRSGLGVGTADGRAVSWAAAGWRLAAAGLGGGWAVAGSCARVCRTHRNFLECGAPCGSQRHPSSAGRLEMSRTLSLSALGLGHAEETRDRQPLLGEGSHPVCGAGWGWHGPQPLAVSRLAAWHGMARTRGSGGCTRAAIHECRLRYLRGRMASASCLQLSVWPFSAAPCLVSFS